MIISDKNNSKRFHFIDFLKTIAILAVFLYHVGILPFGYLGVDVFLVVGGFFFIGQVRKQIERNEFNYWRFIIQKIIRLWPLVLLSVIVSVFIGYWLMLPDDYENLAESAVASSFFANNVLQCITTKDYWDIVNQYKPLMHLWYIGVLMQAYITVPIILIVSTRKSKDVEKRILYTLIVITGISFFLYLLPLFSSAWKFYYLPFRLFEITAGGLLSFLTLKISDIWRKALLFMSSLLVLLMLCINKEIISSQFMLIIIVLMSLVFILCSQEICVKEWICSIVKMMGSIGKRSYSIYIWHQVIIAFLFYSFLPTRNLNSVIIASLLTIVISLISYHFIELPLGSIKTNKRKEKIVLVCSIITCIMVSGLSFVIYLHAGVVRDVPELDIKKEDVHKNMHAEYCDRPYSWNRDFSSVDKTKVLVIGNSFGRDWANILYEFDVERKLEISYVFFANEYSDKDLFAFSGRIEDANYVFCSTFSGIEGITVIPKDKLYIVGSKNYGESNGIFFSRRNTTDYYQQTVELSRSLLESIQKDSERFGDHYINMMQPVMKDTTHAYVFTDDYKFISQDCCHLTKAGAQYYSRVLDLSFLYET